MPRQELVWTIFVASPSDVTEERDALERVVADVNRLLSAQFEARFELIRWERDVSPAYGKDPQALVNEQTPRDYDIFIGVWWNRIGTPTARARSGTLEEFHEAKNRHDADPESVTLMLYFKTVPPTDMSDFDPDQYKAVQEFKAEVRGQAIYGEFPTATMFESSVREHLIRWLQGRQLGTQEPQEDPSGKSPTSELLLEPLDFEEDEEDEGYLELEELIEAEQIALNEALEALNDSITKLNSEINSQAKEFTNLSSATEKPLSTTQKKRLRVEAKRVAKRTALTLNTFVSETSISIPVFRTSLDRTTDAMVRFIPLYLELNGGEDDQDLEGKLQDMYNSMDGAYRSMQGFQESFSKVPRLSVELSKARRAIEKSAQDLVAAFRHGLMSFDAVFVLFPEKGAPKS